MFEPQNDRVDYGRLLAPPDGYETDFAVGTTYSLDLDAFIGACISLGLGEDTDSELFDDPIFMLDVLHKTSKKIALFCEGGQIHAPAQAKSLYALLENSVAQVMLDGRGDMYPSFHPKFWLIRYTNKTAAAKYRVIVLSRNLTFDNSWDVVAALDGTQTAVRTDKNKPIKDFLGFLKNFLPPTRDGRRRAKRMTELAAELDGVAFALDDRAFCDFEFIPLGIGDYTIRSYPLFDRSRRTELCVMSPFLSKRTVAELGARRKPTDKKPALFTRRQSLVGFSQADLADFDVYCMRNEVADGESKPQDIHAKLYMLRTTRDPNTQLYLGSMNASQVATGDADAAIRNVEFMIKLDCKHRYLDLDKLKMQFFRGEENDGRNPFERVELTEIPTDAEPDEKLDRAVKTLCRARMYARVEPSGDGSYRTTVDIACKPIVYPVSVCPLFSGRAQPLASRMAFDGLTVKELSRFYRVTVTGSDKTIERIISIPTDGIPETRDEKIISEIVRDEKSFFAYLSFVLGDTPVLGAIDALRMLQVGGAGGSVGASLSGLYEKMLKTAATSPEKLDGIDYLMRAVSADGVIPPEFAKLYAIFEKAVKRR